MKKLSKLMCLLLAVGMLMGIASCSSDAGEGGGGSSGGTETVRISCGPLNGYQNVLYNSIADMMNKANPGKYSFAIEASTGLRRECPPAGYGRNRLRHHGHGYDPVLLQRRGRV